MRSLVVLGALLAVPFVVGTAVGLDAGSPDEAFAFQDQQIVESSGLTVDGDLVLTTNDSGDEGRVFAVDEDGATVGVTVWSAEPDDVEALAPAGPGEVWVGDIGDNPENRESISVSRVPVGRGEREVDAPSYELVYPDGAHDAETLLADPASGQLYVITKVVFGGSVYAAPERLDPDQPNDLREVGTVAGLITDGTFLADGDHVVLRTYTQALVYSFPDFALVGDVALPRQQQGEGIAVREDGSLLLSSEGVEAPVLRFSLPQRLIDRMETGPTSSATPSAAAPTATPSPQNLPVEPPREEARPDVQTYVIGFVVMFGIVIVLVRALRPR